MNRGLAAQLDWEVVQRKLPFLAALPAAARASVRLVNLDAGELLFRAGATPAAMFCVLSGEVRLVRLSRTGSEVVLQRARKGILAEASLDQVAYHCDAIATVQATVLRLSRPVVRQALREEGFAAAWRAELSRELRRLRAQCERLSLNTARERIMHYIETEGENGMLMLSQTKKQWAAELGLTHEALYRSLAQMEKFGLVRINAGGIRLARVRAHRARD
jgi:CRP-like cAMP-binding protein